MTGWTESEPGLWEGLREARRLLRRGLRRWLPSLLALLALVGLAAARRVQKKPLYPAKVLLRLSEGDGDVGAIPRTNNQLQEYVQNVVFTDARLLEIAKRRGLQTSMLAKNPVVALDNVRDEISVEVFRNHFVEDRAAGDPPRSARISIRFRAPDPDVAVAVVHDLVDVLREHELKKRKDEADAAQRTASIAVGLARADLERLDGRIAALELAVAERPKDGAADRVELVRLLALRPTEQVRLDEAEELAKAVALRVGVEREQMGLRFDVADESPPMERRSLPLDLALTALAALLLGGPFVLLVVGAFDRRVYDAAEVRRLGFTSLGVVRAWPERRT